MNKIWTDDGWDDYVYWQTQDKKTSHLLSEKNRLVYKIEDGSIHTLQCRNHYDDK